MTIRKALFPNRKRELPFAFDKTIKALFRIGHVLSFGILFGGAYFQVEEASAYAWFAIISGLLIMFREIYKEGAWLCQTRGVLTIFKVLLLFALLAVGINVFIVLLLVAVTGILASHLPKGIRKKELAGFCRLGNDTT